MSKKTPALYASGKWVLKSPWLAAPDVNYTCHAIRSLQDIEKMGIDAYERFYAPTLTDGAMVNGRTWRYSEERLLLPNIITLISTDNRIIYVPDTFILGFPDASEFKYSQVVLSVPLGILPDNYDISNLTNAVKDKVNTMLGIDVKPVVAVASLTTNPTMEEHLSLEANRLAAIRNTTSVETQLIQERVKTAALQRQNQMYEDILRQNGLLN